jgi:hypothetical protein
MSPVHATRHRPPSSAVYGGADLASSRTDCSWDHMPLPVAVDDFGKTLLEVNRFASWTGCHVAGPQRVSYSGLFIREVAHFVGDSTQFGLSRSSAVVRDQPSQARTPHPGTDQVPGSIHRMETAHPKFGGVADVMQPGRPHQKRSVPSECDGQPLCLFAHGLNVTPSTPTKLRDVEKPGSKAPRLTYLS